MKSIAFKFLACLAFLGLVIIPTQSLFGQGLTPAVLDSASLQSQMDYLQERTRIYDGYRAIRDDLFQKIRTNAVDSLNKEKLEVARLNSELTEQNFQIETLNSELTRAKNERDQAIRTKDSFSIMGIQMQKGLYSTVMWIIVLGLAVVSVLLFLMFKRGHVITSHTKKELENIQEEYDEYRKSSREKYEKLVVSHHNEIIKLKRS